MIFKNLFIYFIYLFLAAQGLPCCVRAFSSGREQGLLFVAVRGLLIVVASLVEEHGLQAPGLQQLWRAGFSSCSSWILERRLSSCGARAQLLCSMWDLSGPGLEPVSPALAGRFLTTAPPGKPLGVHLKITNTNHKNMKNVALTRWQKAHLFMI